MSFDNKHEGGIIMKRTLACLLTICLLNIGVPLMSGAETANPPVPLTIATQDSYYAAVSYNDDLEIWKMIEDKLNIDITWEVTASEYDTVIATRLAAATNLPDIIRLPGNPTNYGQQGLVIPLEDLIYEKCPDIVARFEEFPLVEKYSTSVDGHIYALGAIIQDNSRIGVQTFMIRQDWLDALDLDVPQNMEDVYNVLSAFVSNDLNGNGIADEIGFMGENWRAPFAAFGTGYGLYFNFNEDSADGFYYDDEGNIYYQWTQPETKELLTFLNKMYNAGLFDDSYGGTGIDSGTMIANNLVGSTFFWQDHVIQYSKFAASNDGVQANYIITEPIEGPAGRAVEEYGVVTGYTAISKDCQNVDAALSLMNFLYSQEGAYLMSGGIEGVTYDIDAVSGKPIIRDEVKNSPDGVAMVNVLRTYGAWPTFMWVQDSDFTSQTIPESYLKDAEEKLEPYYVMPLQILLGTSDMDQAYATIMTDIKTYTEEMMVKFVRGEVPLDSFDDYVSTVNDMGIEEARAIKQELYDTIILGK